VRGEVLEGEDRKSAPSASTLTLSQFLFINYNPQTELQIFHFPIPDQQIFRDVSDYDGRTALHIAAILNRDNTAKILFDLGSDPCE